MDLWATYQVFMLPHDSVARHALEERNLLPQLYSVPAVVLSRQDSACNSCEADSGTYTHLASERIESSRFLLLQHVGADALKQGSKIVDDEMGSIGSPVDHSLVGRRIQNDTDM